MPTLSVNIKGPNELKLQIDIGADKTVLDLKQMVAAKSDVEVDRQRLIYSGRVLKDEDSLESYKIQSTHTIHMVKGASKSNPTTSSSPSSSAGAPSMLPTMQSGQNPLDPLTALESHRGYGSMAGLNPFADMGLNQNDPNMMQNMMQDPAFLNQMAQTMSNPDVMEQIMSMNPQLQGMAPQMREIMRSDRFRAIMSNPDTLRSMLQMSQIMQGSGLSNTAFPAPGTPGTMPSTTINPGTNASENSNFTATPGGMFGGLDPSMLAALGGFGGSGGGGLGSYPGAPAGGLGDPNAFSNMLSAMQGGAGASPSAPADTRSPEERYQHQLQQLQDMGFTNGAQNVRALLANGGNVHSAIEYILGGQGLQ